MVAENKSLHSRHVIFRLGTSTFSVLYCIALYHTDSSHKEQSEKEVYKSVLNKRNYGLKRVFEGYESLRRNVQRSAVWNLDRIEVLESGRSLHNEPARTCRRRRWWPDHGMPVRQPSLRARIVGGSLARAHPRWGTQPTWPIRSVERRQSAQAP